MSLAKFLNVIELRSGKLAREPAQPFRMAQSLGPSVLAVPWVGRAWAWKPHAAELGLAIACYLVYFLSRGAVFPNLDQVALQNTSRVIAVVLLLPHSDSHHPGCRPLDLCFLPGCSPVHIHRPFRGHHPNLRPHLVRQPGDVRFLQHHRGDA